MTAILNKVGAVGSFENSLTGSVSVVTQAKKSHQTTVRKCQKGNTYNYQFFLTFF